MSNETQFINGLIVKAPHENAPEYIKAKLSIKREELIATLKGMSGEWINADIKVSQGGKWYVAIDTWKPNQGGTTGGAQKSEQRPASMMTSEALADDDIPF